MSKRRSPGAVASRNAKRMLEGRKPPKTRLKKRK
jgi:hypothetical protein